MTLRYLDNGRYTYIYIYMYVFKAESYSCFRIIKNDEKKRQKKKRREKEKKKEYNEPSEKYHVTQVHYFIYITTIFFFRSFLLYIYISSE